MDLSREGQSTNIIDPRKCKTPGCPNRARLRDWCLQHYKVWYRDIKQPVPGKPRGANGRFIEKLTKTREQRLPMNRLLRVLRYELQLAYDGQITLERIAELQDEIDYAVGDGHYGKRKIKRRTPLAKDPRDG